MLRGLLVDYFGVLTEPPLADALSVARAKGLRTGLVSNAAQLPAGAKRLAGLFDAIVLSGEAGVGKPDPRIYLLAAERLGLIPEQCVFVDDLRSNVLGAATAGMVGVHHTEVATTLDELAVLFDFPLR